jgi:hypothetical protein
VAKSKEFYKWIKIAGFASFIPFVLIAGPLSGYLLGVYLKDLFRLGNGIILFSVLAGLMLGLFETARIIRMMIKVERKV